MKKYVALFLALLLTSSVCVSCAKTDPQPQETHPPMTQGEEEETRLPLEVPATRYDDKTLTFLVRDGDDTWGTNEIFCETINEQTDNFSQAVYERNDRIFNHYGVTIQEIREGATTHTEKIQQEVMAPTGDYQAIVSDTSVLTNLGANACLFDLKSDYIEYLDFSKPWWDTQMAESMSINGHLYFATGDLLIDDNEATFAMMFNKDIAKDHNLEDIYSLVDKQEWTLNKFYEMEQKVKKDMDNDGKMGYGNDVVGFAYTADTSYCLLFGSGVMLCTKDADDYPTYSLNVERAQDVTDLGRLILAPDCALNLVTAATGGVPYWEAGDITFSNGKALFYAQCMNTVSGLRNYEVNFGIVPFPKYDKAQDKYYSLMHSGSSASFAIPRSVDQDELTMITSIIEAMAYHSVDTLTEQYYEINLKLKSAKDEQSAPMIDLILANRIYDLAYYYGWGNNAYNTLAAGLSSSGSGSSVSSLNQRFKGMITKNIQDLTNKIEKFES